jgi:hypothetical protein
MVNLNKSEPVKFNQGIFDFVSKILVSFMMVCMTLTASNLIVKFTPAWKTEIAAVFSLLVALERLFTYKISKRLVVLSKSWVAFYTSQLIVTILLLKIILMAYDRFHSIWITFQLWQMEFFTNFFDIETLGMLAFSSIVWFLSGYFAGLLDEMSLEEALIKFDMAVKAPFEEIPPRERLLGLIFGGGFFMVAITAISRVQLRQVLRGGFEDLAIQPLPYLAAGAWSVLLYFILGLVLISLSQFARLNARWHFQRITVSPTLAKRWAIYSTVSIALVAFLASLLPTNYSLGLLSVLRYLIQLVLGIFAFLFGVIGTILVFLFSQLLMLFGGKEPSEDIIVQSYEPPEMPSELIQPGEDPSLGILKAVFFWAIFLIVVGFSVYQFVRQHEGIWLAIKKIQRFKWFHGFKLWIMSYVKRGTGKISEIVESGLIKLRWRRNTAGDSVRRGLISLGRLSPRQRVYYFFLALVRRGSQRGLVRKENLTPYEYAEILEQALPEVDQDIASITDAFVSARYSRLEIEKDVAKSVKLYWGRIRDALRSFRR